MKSVLPFPEMTEKQFATAFEKLLRFNGWHWYHTYRSDRSPKGFPDYVCARFDPPGFFFAELKTATGKLTPEQVTWVALLEATGQEVHVFRPADLEEIAARLSRRRK